MLTHKRPVENINSVTVLCPNYENKRDPQCVTIQQAQPVRRIQRELQHGDGGMSERGKANLKVPGRDGDPTGRGDQEWPEGRVQDEMQ